MATKRTKRKATKQVGRKKVGKSGRAKRKTGKAAIPKTAGSEAAMALLRAWSPARYSSR
jgi:hypothetical protein